VGRICPTGHKRVNGYVAIISTGRYDGVSIAVSTFVIKSSQSTPTQQYHLQLLITVSSLAVFPELCKFTTLTFSEALIVEYQSYNVE
jgi:hypothetical protein